MATQLWVNREYRRGLSTVLWGPSVEGQRSGDVSYLHHLGVARQKVQEPIAQGGLSPRASSLMMSLELIILSILTFFTAWGRPVRKSRIQLQREVFSTRVLSLKETVVQE